jgi:hypothetical protein
MEELSTILWRLSRDIVNTVEILKNNGKIRKVNKIWFREKVTNFEYKEGVIGYSSIHEYFVKEEWDLGDIYRIMESEIKKLPIFINAYKCISEIYNVNESLAEFWLSQFAHSVVTKALEAPLNEEELLELVILFLDDLEQRPIIWNVIVELNGLWLKDEEIKIDKNLKIRKLQPKDFEFEYPLDKMIRAGIEIARHLEYPSAILEMTQKSQSQPPISYELEKLIIALRLYKPGSIINLKAIWKPKSILKGEFTTGSTFIQPEVYRYSLSSEETLKLKTFLNKIKPLLPITQRSIETTDHISISLQRYNDALFKPVPTERLAYAIMGLEALFLKSSERVELAHKLAQRAAKCLSLFGYHSLEVYRTIKQSYKIRSDFVHGSLVSKERSHDVNTLADKVIKYLQISILMFLELKNKVKKDNFLNIVDHSLIYPDASVELEKLIKESCSITITISSG